VAQAVPSGSAQASVLKKAVKEALSGEGQPVGDASQQIAS
jgi:hypothetical protein